MYYDKEEVETVVTEAVLAMKDYLVDKVDEFLKLECKKQEHNAIDYYRMMLDEQREQTMYMHEIAKSLAVMAKRG